jgi:hypothetical protein
VVVVLFEDTGLAERPFGAVGAECVAPAAARRAARVWVLGARLEEGDPQQQAEPRWRDSLSVRAGHFPQAHHFQHCLSLRQQQRCTARAKGQGLYIYIYSEREAEGNARRVKLRAGKRCC